MSLRTTLKWYAKQPVLNLLKMRALLDNAIAEDSRAIATAPPKPLKTEGLTIVDHEVQEAVTLPYPDGPLMRIRRFLVIHFTAGATAKSSWQFWKTKAARGAEAHFLIDRDGTIYQVRRCDQKADHAGRSKWRDPKTGKVYSGLNSNSLGIEMANGGNSKSLIRRFSKLSAFIGRHKNGGPKESWEQYTPEQIESCKRLSLALVQTYNLDDLVGHDDIAPSRKNDPGPAFPMQEVREFCGFKGLPKF